MLNLGSGFQNLTDFKIGFFEMITISEEPRFSSLFINALCIMTATPSYSSSSGSLPPRPEGSNDMTHSHQIR